MRWRFPDPANLEEARQREIILARIDAWWRAFERAAPEIEKSFSRKATFDLPAFMTEHLGAIEPELMWEFGPGLEKRHRLVITPETRIHLMPLVRAILDRAPSLDRFELYPSRLAETGKWARATIQGRTGVDLATIRIAAMPGEHGRIDVRVAFTANELDGDAAHSAAFVTIETLLGEDVLEHWIGSIAVEPRPKPSLWGRITGAKGDWPQVFEAPETLKARVDALIARSQQSLPAVPWVKAMEDGSAFLLKRDMPAGHPSGECSGRSDWYVAGTLLPIEVRKTFDAPGFSSLRISRHGETFAYLKLDGIGGLEGSVYADRRKIEDAVDEALQAANAGCVCGGGTGRRYSYIDLVLSDLDSGVDAIRRVLRAGRIQTGCWILFFDPELSEEWVGIYPDTPPPPSDPE